MKRVSVSEFKARCLALMAEVNEKRVPLLVTKRGQPLVRILPARDGEKKSWLGCMKGTGTIRGDLIEPPLPPEAWNVLRS
ncbi:MAG: type II toxin-antitoxin system Phd/YefM family antitoxin [Planctomycetota bacterium]|jgi:prevent-host-death family protein